MGWFQGRTAVVTGAARGIGRGVAEQLAELDARVVAVDVDEAALSAAFIDGPIVRWSGDVAGDAASLGSEIASAHGPIELLVNNVGIDTPHDFLTLDEENYERVIRTNLRGPWFLTRELVSRMVAENRRGAVVFVSSLHDSFVRGYPHYSASKAAVTMLVKELAQQLGPHGIRVNAVSPGVIESGRVPSDSTAADRATSQRLIPLGRKGTPGDVSRVIAMLLSEEWCGYVTGANVRVDGGLGVHSWSFDDG